MLYSTSESPLLQNSRRAAGLSYFRSAVTDHILVSYQAAGKSGNCAWLQSLSDDCLQSFAQLRAKKKQAFHNEHIFRSTVVSMVDRIMEKLHYFALQFNLEVGWDLHVSTTRPSFVTEVVHYNFRREPVETITIYRARLSTRLWSLVVRGHGPLIEFFVLPAQIVIGLSRSESQNRAILEMRAVRQHDEVQWLLNGRNLPGDQVDGVCETAFKNLIARCLHDSGLCEDSPSEAADDEQWASNPDTENAASPCDQLAGNVQFFDYEATTALDFQSRCYFDYDTGTSSLPAADNVQPSAGADLKDGLQNADGVRENAQESVMALPETNCFELSLAMADPLAEAESRPGAQPPAAETGVCPAGEQEISTRSNNQPDIPAPAGKKISVGKFLERLHYQMLRRQAEDAASQGNRSTREEKPVASKAEPLAPPSPAGSKACAIKDAALEIKEAASELKETAPELKEAALEIKSAARDFKEAAADIKDAALEIKESPTVNEHPERQTKDSHLEMTLPPSSPDSKQAQADEVPGGFIMSEDHFANVISALDFLIDEIELDICLLGRSGAEAFRCRDMQKVQALCVKAREKNEFKFTIAQLRNEWENLEEIRLAVKDYMLGAQASPSLISSVSLRRPAGVPAAFDTALEALELTLDLFGRMGAQAFEARDFAKVEASRIQSLEIIEFQLQLNTAARQWQALSPDADAVLAVSPAARLGSVELALQ